MQKSSMRPRNLVRAKLLYKVRVLSPFDFVIFGFRELSPTTANAPQRATHIKKSFVFDFVNKLIHNLLV